MKSPASAGRKVFASSFRIIWIIESNWQIGRQEPLQMMTGYTIFPLGFIQINPVLDMPKRLEKSSFKNSSKGIPETICIKYPKTSQSF